MTHPFCPKCGKETKDLIKGFCIDCFTGKKEFVEVPKEIKIDQCKHCNSISLKHKWRKFDLQELKEYAKSKIKVNLLKDQKISLAFLDRFIKVHVKGKFSSKKIEREFEIPFKVCFTTCDLCMKKSADFWQVKIQLRKAKSFDPQLHEKLKKEFSMLADSEKQTKQGSDFYFVDRAEIKNKLRNFMKRYHFKALESRRFAGFTKRQAKKVKYTYCIRV